MAKAAALVIFPGGSWDSLAEIYGRLFQPFADHYKLYLVSDHPITAAPPSLTTITLAQVPQMDWSHCMAAVLHPCWVQVVIAAKPLKIIALLDPPHPEEPPLWSKCRTWLSGHADLIITATETLYLEQAFRSELTFLLDHADEVNELLVRQGVGWMLEGHNPTSLVRLQQRCLAEGLHKRLQADEDGRSEHRLQRLFFHAVYRYLIDDVKLAAEETAAAFELATLQGEPDALVLYYRFLSAIELKTGLTRQAVQTYSFSAVSAEEKILVDRMDRMLGNNQDTLAAALLYYLNDDYNLAFRQLALLPPCEESVRLAIEMDTARGHVSQAAKRLSGSDPAGYRLIYGTAAMLGGHRHEAIHAFLKVAAGQEEALGNIVEIALLDAAVQRLAQAVSGGGLQTND